MAYEFLKKLFGTPKDGEEPKTMTYAELEAAIDADKKIQVVDVKAGGYVSKEKLDAKITELDGVKQQLSDANTTIQSYKDMDIDGIKQSAKDWETKYTQETQKLTAQLAAQERTHALDMFMGGYKFSSKPAENGVRAEFEKKNFTLEYGKFLGGDEFMKSLMENDDYKGAVVFDDDDFIIVVCGFLFDGIQTLLKRIPLIFVRDQDRYQRFSLYFVFHAVKARKLRISHYSFLPASVDMIQNRTFSRIIGIFFAQRIIGR